MMSSPVTAMIWICWRMTRRWYIPVLLIAIGIGELVFNNVGVLGVGKPMKAGLEVSLQILMLACLTTLSAMSLSNKEGFPFRYQYRQPISTALLVTVPMLYMNILCASIAFIPLLLFKLQFDLPFPVLAPVVVIILLASTLLAASWATTNTSARGLGLLGATFYFSFFIAWFRPFHFSNSAAGVTPLSDFAVLSPLGYLITLMSVSGLLFIVILTVRQQRCGEAVSLVRAVRSMLYKGSFSPQSAEKAGFFERLSDRFTLPCPDNSPWRAESWMELKRFGMPILMFSAMLALMVPVLFIAESALDWNFAGETTLLMPPILFFTAIGIALFNRRMDSGGFMNVFEASRSMGTIQLLMIQFSVLALSILAGILLISLSIGLSSWLLPVKANFVLLKLQEQWLRLAGQPLATSISAVVIGLVYFLTAIAGFFCMHSCSVFWGRKFLIGILALVFYILNYLMYLIFSGPSLESLIRHMWGASLLIFVISALGIVGMLTRRVLTRHNLVIALAAWGLYLLFATVGFDYRTETLSALGGEMLALNLSVLLLPLGCFMLTAWCYDKLRHG